MKNKNLIIGGVVAAIIILAAVSSTWFVADKGLSGLGKPSDLVPTSRSSSGKLILRTDDIAKTQGRTFAVHDPSLSFILPVAQSFHDAFTSADRTTSDSLRMSYGLKARNPHYNDWIVESQAKFAAIKFDWSKAEYLLTQDGKNFFYLPLDGKNVSMTGLLKEHREFKSGALTLPSEKKVIVCRVPVEMPKDFPGDPSATIYLHFTDGVPNVPWALFQLGIQSSNNEAARGWMPYLQ